MTDRPCPACGGARFLPLPVLGPPSMLSDGRQVARALALRSCLDCGMGGHVDSLEDADVASFYNEDYSLYAHAPGGAFEAQRQDAYADWLERLVDMTALGSLFEAGCGNGSLLAAIRRRRPGLRLQGVEPAAEAAAHAVRAGFDVEAGFFGRETAGGRRADLVLSVNVVEHTPDPVGFLAACAAVAGPDGRVVAICPDGDVPSNELLFFDHIHSFSAAAMNRIAAKAGLGVIGHYAGPPGLTTFRASVMASSRDHRGAAASAGPDVIARGRESLLQGWRDLDAALQERTIQLPRLIGFGAGEAASLIRTYAPRIWARLEYLVVDGGGGAVGELPVRDYAALGPAAGEGLLLLVEPAKQARLAARLAAEGRQAVVWGNLVGQPAA